MAYRKEAHVNSRQKQQLNWN